MVYGLRRTYWTMEQNHILQNQSTSTNTSPNTTVKTPHYSFAPIRQRPILAVTLRPWSWHGSTYPNSINQWGFLRETFFGRWGRLHLIKEREQIHISFDFVAEENFLQILVWNLDDKSRNSHAPDWATRGISIHWFFPPLPFEEEWQESAKENKEEEEI